VDTLLDDVALLRLKAEGVERGNENSSLTFKAHNKLTLLEAEFRQLQEVSDGKSVAALPLMSLQSSIVAIKEAIKENVLPELAASVAYPIVEKVEDLKALLVETQAFDRKVEELRVEFEALKRLIDQLDGLREATPAPELAG